MTSNTAAVTLSASSFKSMFRRVLAFMTVLIVSRFVLEVAGVPETMTRYFSATAGIFLAAIYLGAVGPLRGGLKTLKDIPLPGLILSAWTVGCVVVLTLLSALLRIESSHFAEKEDHGNLANLGVHVLGHLIELLIFFILAGIILVLMQTVWRWPVTVGPVAVIGALVVIRFTVEAMGLDAVRTAPWSSTIGVLLSSLFLGAMAARAGYATARQLLVPSMVVAFAWRFWILLVTLISAFVPFFKTHFFDPSQGQIAWRLLRFVAGGVLMEGAVVGLMVWGIAVWIFRATRPAAEA